MATIGATVGATGSAAGRAAAAAAVSASEEPATGHQTVKAAAGAIALSATRIESKEHTH